MNGSSCRRRRAAVRDAGQVAAGAEGAIARLLQADLERELERIEYFRPPEKRGTMTVNMRNIFTRMQPTQQDIRTLHGVIMALVEGRKGPARGGAARRAGSRDAAHAAGASTARPRSCSADCRCAGWRGCCAAIRPMRSARLWAAMTGDRRFADLGFKRQTPIGPHVADFVSFPLRLVVDVLPDRRGRRRRRRAAARSANWLPSATTGSWRCGQRTSTTDLPLVLDRLASEARACETSR